MPRWRCRFHDGGGLVLSSCKLIFTSYKNFMLTSKKENKNFLRSYTQVRCVKVRYTERMNTANEKRTANLEDTWKRVRTELSSPFDSLSVRFVHEAARQRKLVCINDKFDKTFKI